MLRIMKVKNLQCHPQAVGQKKNMQWDCLSQNVQCHSQSVGHRKRCDETAFHKMCNVTHFLLVTGKNVMNHETAFHKCLCQMSLTSCWSQEKMCSQVNV